MDAANLTFQPARQLTSHKVNPANDTLYIQVVDQPGSGGANHEYEIGGWSGSSTILKFQNGPINEVGVNGLTHEALTAVLIDRFEAFQRGPFACAENQRALECFRGAQEAMHARTKRRMAKGVEGTNKPD